MNKRVYIYFVNFRLKKHIRFIKHIPFPIS